jgi:hypothetical protein
MVSEQSYPAMEARLESFALPWKATIMRFLGTHLGETNGLPQWANRKLF